MKKGKLIRQVFTDDVTIDFNKVSRDNGVYQLVLQNVGETVVKVADFTNQIINPGETFVIESPVPVVDAELPISFNHEDGKKSKIIINYIVAFNLC